MTIGTNQYRFFQYFKEKGEELADHMHEAMAMAREAGLEAWEPVVSELGQVEALAKSLEGAGLRCRSFYTLAKLLDENWRDEVARIVRLAEEMKGLGARNCIANPAAIYDGRKSEQQLAFQLEGLRELTLRLREIGVSLDYHMHAPEFAEGARDFISMMQGTRDVGMGWCLDAHWLFRGVGHSQMAYESYLALFAERISSLHLRQSRDQVWWNVLGEGDLDYGSLARFVKETDFAGPVTIELAHEEGTPRDLDIVEMHRSSAAWVKESFPGGG